MDVAVLGAAVPGRDVAELCVVAGHPVSLHDEDVTDAMDALDVVERHLDDAVDAGTLDPDVRAGAVDRLEATTGLDAAVTDADVVIETTTDDASRLQTRFADVEQLVDRDAIVATSTSGLSVTAAAAGLRHPDRALGLRFSDPLDRQLVEVVVADQTTQEACDRATSFVESLDRSPVVVRDAPGGASTRTAIALEVEAMRLVEEGVAGVGDVDDALELGHGHPVGPLEQADRAGLAERLSTLEHLHAELGSRFEPPEILRELVAAGRTGLASGEGFYVWENGEPTEPALPAPEIPHREGSRDDPARE